MDSKGHKRKQRPELEEAGQPSAKKAKKAKTRESRKGHSTTVVSETGKEKFSNVNAQMTITIPPLYSGPGRPRQAALEMLDSMIMRYVPSMGGVILAHSNLQFLSTTATFLVDSPFTKAEISFIALVWKPTVGSKLCGSISICSPDHIGLLIHKTFNASIPRHHIPTDEWEFEYGALENDPEYGATALGEETAVEEEQDPGRWVHKQTGVSVGGPNGEVEFTIIGLNISQSMLSLIGSLQPDPFNPSHQPLPAISPRKQKEKSPLKKPLDQKPAMDVDESDQDRGRSTHFRFDSEGDTDPEEAVLIEDKGMNGVFDEPSKETDKMSRQMAKEAKLERKRLKEEKKLRKRQRREEKAVAAEDERRKEKKKKKSDET